MLQYVVFIFGLADVAIQKSLCEHGHNMTKCAVNEIMLVLFNDGINLVIVIE